MIPKESVLGIGFFDGSVEDACMQVEQAGGLLVAPSGPGLAGDLIDSPIYGKALKEADLVLADSGLLCLWAKYFSKSFIRRISGLFFLKNLLDRKNWLGVNTCWVMPTAKEAEASMQWLKDRFSEAPEHLEVYLAPIYPKVGKISDDELLAKIEKSKPKFLFIQLGGGTQERLGLFLKQKLSYKPAIICTGAALAFLSGQQAKIPMWADHLFIGWLLRCIHQPKTFIPRYLKAFKLIYLLFKYGNKSPSLNIGDT
jgi:N-acetylglucosaminyldiphosphoundecaprenol N-acetyl-beta-D-mannosaminyltransferase